MLINIFISFSDTIFFIDKIVIFIPITYHKICQYFYLKSYTTCNASGSFFTLQNLYWIRTQFMCLWLLVFMQKLCRNKIILHFIDLLSYQWESWDQKTYIFHHSKTFTNAVSVWIITSLALMWKSIFTLCIFPPVLDWL